MWLAQPRNIAGAINASGLPDPIGPDSLIKWIVTPQIWGAEVTQHHIASHVCMFTAVETHMHLP